MNNPAVTATLFRRKITASVMPRMICAPRQAEAEAGTECESSGDTRRGVIDVDQHVDDSPESLAAPRQFRARSWSPERRVVSDYVCWVIEAIKA